MYNVIYSDRFKEELKEIAVFVARLSNKDAATKLIESIMSSIRLLSHFPKIGILRYLDERSSKEFHLLITGHYFVYYSIFEDTIRIDGIKNTRTGVYKI